MADKRNKDSLAERSHVDLRDPWELKYWTERFGVSEQQLKDAIYVVGVRPEEVKRRLRE